jgi:hypothetical protein
MTFTPTAGYMTPSHFGFWARAVVYDPDAGNNFSFGGFVDIQPIELRSNVSTVGYDVSGSVLVYDNSTPVSGGPGVEIYTEHSVNSGEANLGLQLPDAGTYRHAWYTLDSNNETVSNQLQADWPDATSVVRTLYGLASHQFVLQTGTTDGDVATYMLYMEFDNSNEPTEDYFEISGIHPDTGTTAYDWSPQDDNESCSAFTMKQLICHNSNRVIKETKPTWSIPLYDANTSTMT